MGFNDQTEYPTGLYYNTLAADRDVALAAHGASTDNIKVAWVVISNVNAAVQTLVITDGADATIMTLYIAANSTVVLPSGFQETGLKLTMAVNTADVTVTVVYFE
jgi:hypothetical protein